MENDISSPPSESFAAGLHILIVDDDPTCLLILSKMLTTCSYKVTTCGSAKDALHLLHARKDKYDIVLSDVNMSDMNGFELLEHIGHMVDIPVILMSAHGEASLLMKGVQRGACDYYSKPIRIEVLRNMWKHAFIKKIHGIRDIQFLEGMGSTEMTCEGSNHSENLDFFRGEDMCSVKKRKNSKILDPCVSSPSKRGRIVWSAELHRQFVAALIQIGLEKGDPNKVLKLMNVPWLTRENVANHLQKYRDYSSTLLEENQKHVVAHLNRLQRPSGRDGVPLPNEIEMAPASKNVQVSSSRGSTRSINGTRYSRNIDQKDASNGTQCSTANKKGQHKYVSNGSNETCVELRRHSCDDCTKIDLSLNVSDPSASGFSHRSSSSGSEANSAAFESTFLFRTSHNEEKKHRFKKNE